MSASASLLDSSDADIREGWALGRESWSFHRQFYDRLGREAAFREYGDIIRQIRAGAERLDRQVYRVVAADGRSILVRGGNLYLLGVMPFDWQKPEPEPEPEPAAEARVDPAPAVTEPDTRPSLRSSTLSLAKNPAAARVLAERLRRFGISGTAAASAGGEGGSGAKAESPR
jgi:hypothetical protein